MAKKQGYNQKTKKSNKEKNKTQDIFKNLPPEAQKKLKAIKSRLEKFQKSILKKLEENVIGLALMPPKQKRGQEGKSKMPEVGGAEQMASAGARAGMPSLPQSSTAEKGSKKESKIDKEKEINVLVLVDDSEVEQLKKRTLLNKLIKKCDEIAKGIDENLKPEPILLSEIWQNCYDGKYDLLQLIAMSAPIYDKGMLAAIKIAEIHKNMVLKKFEKYIVSYVLAGSLVQGKATSESDIDVFIVVDDTDVKRMTRAELKDKLRAIIIGMGMDAGAMTGIKNKLNVQVYILTDFWSNIKEANPIIFTFLRDGVPFYDRGIFMPWKQLLKMGKIKPSLEAIDMYMSSGEQLLSRVGVKIKEIGMEDCFYAILTPSQAALMHYGVPPPTPKETPEVMREIFVQKEKLLEEEYVKILENVIQLRKEIEHGTRKELSGKELDKVLADDKKYLKRIKRLFSQIEKIKEKKEFNQIYDNIMTALREVLTLEGQEKVANEDLIRTFEDELISSGKLPASVLRTLNEVVEAKEEYDKGKLSRIEVEKIKKNANSILRKLIDHTQRKRGKEMERAKITVKYGEKKFGEVKILGDEAFITHDLDAEEKDISKANVNEDGSLGATKKASLEEIEEALARKKIPSKVFVKEGMIDSLKNIFGPEIEILVHN